MKKTKKKIPSERSSDEFYTVIKLFENDATLFDCIPDKWFTDENQYFCFWPPIKGKNVAIRALKQEIPDESWEKYPCEVVKGGFATYSCGRGLVREKCSQKYNTSSAEEHVSAAKFRRQHPGLNLGMSGNFDNVFSTQKSNETAENHHGKSSAADESSKNDAVIDLEKSTQSEGQIPSSEQILSRHNSPKSITSHKPASSQGLQISSKRRRIRSTSRENYSHSQTEQGSRKTSQTRGLKSSKKKEKNVGSLPGMYQRCSASTNSPSTLSRSQGAMISQRNTTANSNRVDEQSGSQKSKGSNASCSFSSKCQRSPSPSCQSYSSKGSYSGQSKIGFRKILQRSESFKIPSVSPRRQSASQSLSPSRSPSQIPSRASERRRSRSPSHQNKNANSNRIDRRISSAESKRSKSSSSYSSKRQHSRSRSRQRNSSNGTSSQSEHISRKLSQIRHGSKTSQHHSAGMDKARSSSWQNQMLLTKLMGEVRGLAKTVFYNHQVNDRRLTRMEVSINKIFVRLGDITRSTTTHSRNVSDGDKRHRDTQKYGESSRSRRHEDSPFFDERSPRQRLQGAEFYNESSRRERCEDAQNHGKSSRRFVNPKDQRSLPIMNLNELTEANQQLMNKNFFAFLVNREQEFCIPGRNTSVNVVVTTYLKRFINLRVRSLLTLKELQSAESMTLYADFYHVYLFLIEVVREGYKSCGRDLTEKDANESLRIVWGRTKQLLSDEQKKRSK